MRLVLIAYYSDEYTYSYTESLPITWESKEAAEFEVLRILELKAQYEKDMEKYWAEKKELFPPKPLKPYNGKNPKVLAKLEQKQKEYDELYSAWLKKALECPKDKVMLFGREMYFSDLDEDMKILTLDEWYNDTN